MRTRWLACILVLLSLSAAAIERRPGILKASDGMEFPGEVWFTNGELKIYEGEDAADGRYLRVNQNEVARIDFSVKTSSMQKPWRFKNAGSDEKEYLDGQYPIVELKSETKMKSGQIIKGHLASCAVYVRVQSRENPMDWDTKKFFVKYQYKGEVGQTMKDITFLTSIDMESGKAVAASVSTGCLTGKVDGLGKIEQAAAFGIRRGRAFEGKVDPQTGTFKIANLPEDLYDVSVLTDKGMYVGLSDTSATPQEDLRPLEPNDLADINAHIVKIRDFFDEIRGMAVKGDRNAAKVLVFQRRNKEMYDEGGLKGMKVERLDVWNYHMRQTEWVINQSSRANLFRFMEPANGARRQVHLINKFGAVPIGTDTKNVELNAAEANVQPLPMK